MGVVHWCPARVAGYIELLNWGDQIVGLNHVFGFMQGDVEALI